jgi:hypothetical protein
VCEFFSTVTFTVTLSLDPSICTSKQAKSTRKECYTVELLRFKLRVGSRAPTLQVPGFFSLQRSLAQAAALLLPVVIWCVKGRLIHVMVYSVFPHSVRKLVIAELSKALNCPPRFKFLQLVPSLQAAQCLYCSILCPQCLYCSILCPALRCCTCTQAETWLLCSSVNVAGQKAGAWAGASWRWLRCRVIYT